MKIKSLNSQEILLLFALLFTGLICRLPLYAISPLLSDEGLYASLAVEIFKGDWFLEADHIADKPPLFYYLQALFLILFGNFETILVLPNMIAGMVSIFLVYHMGKKMFSPMAGGVAAFLMAVSPIAAYFSGNGFVESTFNFFFLLAFAMLLSQRWAALGVCMGLAFATKQTVPVFFPLVVAGIWIVHQKSTVSWQMAPTLQTTWRAFKWFLLIGFVPVLIWTAYFAYIPFRVFGIPIEIILKIEGKKFLRSYSQRWEDIEQVLTDFTFGNHWIGLIFFTAIIVHLIGTIFWFFYQWIKLKEIAFVQQKLWQMAIFGYFCAYIILNVMIISHTYPYRYFYPLLFLVFILIGHLFSQIFAHFKHRIPSKKIKYSLLLVPLAYFIWVPAPKIASMVESKQNSPEQDTRALQNVWNQLGTSPRDILFYSHGVGWTLGYYLPDPALQQKYTFGVPEHSGNKTLDGLMDYAERHPYRETFILLFQYDFDKIHLLEKAIAPAYQAVLLHSSLRGRYKIFKLEHSSEALPPPGESLHSTQDWQSFVRNSLSQRWPESAIQVEVKEELLKISAFPVSFGDAKGAEFDLEGAVAFIDVQASEQKQWLLFKSDPNLKFQYAFSDELLEKMAWEGIEHLKTVRVLTENGQTTIHLETQEGGSNLAVDLTFKMRVREGFIYLEVADLAINGWNLTWLAYLLENRFLRKPAPRDELFDGTLYAISQKNQQIVFKFLQAP